MRRHSQLELKKNVTPAAHMVEVMAWRGPGGRVTSCDAFATSVGMRVQLLKFLKALERLPAH